MRIRIQIWIQVNKIFKKSRKKLNQICTLTLEISYFLD